MKKVKVKKTAPGKIVTAPVRIVESAVKSAQDIVEQIPQAAIETTKTLPFILLLLAGGVVAYMVYMGKKGSKLI